MRRPFKPEEIDELLPLIDGARHGQIKQLAARLERAPHVVYKKLRDLRSRPLTAAQRWRLYDLRLRQHHRADASDWIGLKLGKAEIEASTHDAVLDRARLGDRAS